MSLTNPNTPVSQQDLQDFYHKLLPYMGGSSGGSGGGHTIEDSEGTDLTQRDTLQFGEGFLAEDDSTNGKTVISPNLMTSTDMDDVISKFPSVGTKTPRYKITTPRWLRFDPTNKKALVIKGGTSILLSNGEYIDYGVDTHIDLTSDISANGTDYFVYITDDKEVHAYTEKQSTGTYIGRFHTLCVDAGTMTMIAPASPSSGLKVGDTYLVKSYSSETDSDFYNFYNKSITAVSAGAKYDVITCQHPLSGFTAGSILPESVFCLTFHPECLVEDAMVYDKDMNIAVDVYLQSGTGFNTRSKYNATHVVNREQINHAEDFRMVGKQLLDDATFTSIALGSNECTNIIGSSDATTVGGHRDTNNRRMISAIGVEEACGYLWQWLTDLITVSNTSPNNGWCSIDGRDSFGKQYWNTHALPAGGAWVDGTSCGSRCRAANSVRSVILATYGGRGSSQVICF